MMSISSGSIASTPPFERDHHVLDDAVDLRGRIVDDGEQLGAAFEREPLAVISQRRNRPANR